MNLRIRQALPVVAAFLAVSGASAQQDNSGKATPAMPGMQSASGAPTNTGSPGMSGMQPMSGMSPMMGPMMAEMKANDARLNDLVAKMNMATGPDKVNAMAAVMSEMVAQQQAMHQKMMPMMEHMPMGGMQPTSGMPPMPGMAPMPGMSPMMGPMMAEMKANDARLNDLVSKMNAATRRDKANAVAAVINEIVAQQQAMHQKMMPMMEHMPMDGMKPGPMTMPSGPGSMVKPPAVGAQQDSKME